VANLSLAIQMRTSTYESNNTQNKDRKGVSNDGKSYGWSKHVSALSAFNRRLDSNIIDLPTDQVKSLTATYSPLLGGAIANCTFPSYSEADHSGCTDD